MNDTAYTLSNISPDEWYVFRAIAINKAGRSKPSDESEYLQLRKFLVQEAPVIQKHLEDTNVTRNKDLILSCIISGVPEPTIEWFKNDEKINGNLSTFCNRTAKIVMKNITENSSGTYKCVATNDYGHDETKCTVVVIEEPGVHVEERFVSQKLRIDAVYEVIATVTGYPRPKLVWYKSKTKLEAKSNTKMCYEDTHASLNISKLKRSHTGTYVIEASNEHGTSRKELVLSIIDKPSAPEGPLAVQTLKKDTVQLTWKQPRDTGGLELSEYKIEKCCLEQNTWMKVADVNKDTLTYTVSKLKANAQYKFRVTACNAIGESEPLESELVTMRLNMEPPSCPRGPINVSGMTIDSFVISWTKSESDGGSAILEYIVELKQSTEAKWCACGSTRAHVTNLAIANLRQNTGYDIRIMATNAVGRSPYLTSEESIITGQLPSKYFMYNVMASNTNAAPNIAEYLGLIQRKFANSKSTSPYPFIFVFLCDF